MSLTDITAAKQLIKALKKDGFTQDTELRTERIYRHPDGRKVSIHYHTGSETYGASLLQSLFEDIEWTENKMIELKLIKK